MHHNHTCLHGEKERVSFRMELPIGAFEFYLEGLASPHQQAFHTDVTCVVLPVVFLQAELDLAYL